MSKLLIPYGEEKSEFFIDTQVDWETSSVGDMSRAACHHRRWGRFREESKSLRKPISYLNKPTNSIGLGGNDDSVMNLHHGENASYLIRWCVNKYESTRVLLFKFSSWRFHEASLKRVLSTFLLSRGNYRKYTPPRREFYLYYLHWIISYFKTSEATIKFTV